MSMMSKIIILYLVVMNLVSFCVFGADKQKARKGKWRISEGTLLGVAFLGGSFGALLGMHVFRHKIRKARFAFGVPILALLQVGIILFVFYYI